MTEVLSVFTVSLPAALRPMICWKRVMDGKNEPAICIWSLSEKRRKTI